MSEMTFRDRIEVLKANDAGLSFDYIAKVAESYLGASE